MNVRLRSSYPCCCACVTRDCFRGRIPVVIRSLLLLLLLLLSVVRGSNQTILQINELTLDPAEEFHIAVETFFPGSGYVDLSGVGFEVSLSGVVSGSGAGSTTYLDIVLVKLGEHCFQNKVGGDCDWTTNMGIGEYSADHVPWYCCSREAIEVGVCTDDRYGRLLIRPKNALTARNITIDPAVLFQAMSETSTASQPPVLYLQNPSTIPTLSGHGTYALIFANCNTESGHTVIVHGETDWISYQAQIEAFIHENVPFYVIMTILHVGLWMWYRYHMKLNQDSRIRLEEWMETLILLGAADALLGWIQNALWEQGTEQHHFVFVRLVAICSGICGGIKHALSRCLLLMLSLGWGVVHPTLDPTQATLIVTLGILFCTLRTLADVAYGLGWATSQFVSVCMWSTIAVDGIFSIWIPVALFQTMHYLEASHQTAKLERYRWLLYILGLAVAMTFALVVWIALGQLSMLHIIQANEFNFFIVLTCMAILWKPNPLAREYAYAMELYMGDDDDDDDNNNNNNNPVPREGQGREPYSDLELTETVKNEIDRPSSIVHRSGSMDDNLSSATEDSTDYTQFPPIVAESEEPRTTPQEDYTHFPPTVAESEEPQMLPEVT